MNLNYDQKRLLTGLTSRHCCQGPFSVNTFTNHKQNPKTSNPTSKATQTALTKNPLKKATMITAKQTSKTSQYSHQHGSTV
jgi:hypothetical protein